MSDSLWSILSGGSYGKSFTLHFDGSHNNQANESGAGCIIRDNHGELVVAAAYNLTEAFPDSCNVAIVEAVALRNGLQLAKENNVSLSLIKGDSKEVIDHVLGCNTRPSKQPLSGIIQQIVEMINYSKPKMVHINREENKAADKLASWGCTRVSRGRQIFKTCAELPPQVAELVKQEMLGSSSKNENEGEGSSVVGNIVKVGAAVAGVAMFAMEFSKLLSESSSDQNEHNKSTSKAKALPTCDFTTHNNTYASTYDRNKKSNYHDYFILHFNGSDINQQDKGGAGCIIRNKEGELVVAGAYNLDDLNRYPKQFHVAIAGAVAFRNGLKLAKQNNVKLHLIKGVNEEVINRVRGQQKRSPEVQFLSELIDEIKKALYQQSIDPQTQVKLIEEAANRVAHELAYYGSKDPGYASEKIYFLEDDLPPKVAQLFQQDKRIWRANSSLM